MVFRALMGAAGASGGTNAASPAASSQAGAAVADSSPMGAAPISADPRPVASVSHASRALPILVAVGVGLVGAAIFLAVRYRRLEPARQTAARARNRRPTRPPV